VKYVAAQSLDNQILIYSADGSFRQNRKKRFAGHTSAGYACAIGFSPDGHYLTSGDGAGNLVFWDWKSGKIQQRMPAHDRVLIDHVWLPNERVSAGYRSPVLTTVKTRYSVLGWSYQAVGIDALQFVVL
jgi:WD40 repeat protein